jgi:hypothetical protein
MESDINDFLFYVKIYLVYAATNVIVGLSSDEQVTDNRILSLRNLVLTFFCAAFTD